MFGFILLCAIGVLTQVNIFGSVAAALDSQPRLGAVFNVTYNASRALHKECAQYYATQFLGHMKTLNENNMLQDMCQNVNPPSVSVQAKLTVKAFFHNTEINISATVEVFLDNRTINDRDTWNKTTKSCLSELTTKLGNPRTFAPGRRGHILKVLGGNSSISCADATMSESRMRFWKSEWLCKADMNYTEKDFRCVPAKCCNECIRDLVERSTCKDIRSSVEKCGGSITSIFQTLCSQKDDRKQDLIDNICENTTNVCTTIPPNTPSPSPTSPVRIDPTSVPDTVTSEFSTSESPNLPETTQVPPCFKLDKEIPDTINLTEGDGDFSLLFNLTTSNCGCQADKCAVIFEVEQPEVNPQPRCLSTGKSIKQVVVAPSSSSARENWCKFPIKGRGRTEIDIPLVAKLDGKYDGTQVRNLIIKLQKNTSAGVEETQIKSIVMNVVNRDKKATCQSINDPHITTFDGLQYNNFFEGEFILYQSGKNYAVHVIFQKCHPSINASCNCGVAVKSGDDVIIFDKCRRKRKPFKRPEGPSRDVSPFLMFMYKNEELTPGTKIYSTNDGKVNYVLLPQGTVVKVMLSGDLLNVWVVPSADDYRKTEGLCGTYDGDRDNDTKFKGSNETEKKVQVKSPELQDRWQPNNFSITWRVDIGGSQSLFSGVEARTVPLEPRKYCECPGLCDYSLNVETCDLVEGEEITNEVPVRRVEKKKRNKRAVRENETWKPSEPIIIDKNFVPPKYKWPTKSGWNKTYAYQFCDEYLQEKFMVGRECSKIPAVDVDQERKTCMEDIKITDSAKWKESALGAMKEQCKEAVKNDPNLPSETVKKIQSNMCLNECSSRGTCINGSCKCEIGFGGSDCSVDKAEPPYLMQIPADGLCDTRYTNCSSTRVYGDSFLKSPNLKCKLQPVEVNNQGYTVVKKQPVVGNARFINFNTVECDTPVPHKYLLHISNNGQNYSHPLLFIGYDSICYECSSANFTCVRKPSTCKVDHICYREGETMPNNKCMVCRGQEWTTDESPECRQNPDARPLDWHEAMYGIVGGSVGALIGLVVGILLYKFCCKRKSTANEGMPQDTLDNLPDRPMGDYRLHRNRNLPEFGNIDEDVPFPPSPRHGIHEQWGYANNGRGVENGVDDTTYF